MRPQRQLELLLFVGLLATFGYFFRTQPGWNANSRLALTFALVERHTARIDTYWKQEDLLTEDVAVFNGHHYSDKIIGVSLMGVPPYWLIRTASDILDISLTTAQKRYWVTLLTIGVSGALSAVIMFRLLLLWYRRLDSDTAGAELFTPFLVTLSIYLGTMLLSYATLYMSYIPAHAFFVAAVYVFESRSNNRTVSREGGPLPVLLVGLLCGLSILCEYLFAFPVALFSLYAWHQLRARWQFLLMAMGVSVGIFPFVVYTYTIFGRPMIPYQFHYVEDFRKGMAHGIMGATMPRPSAMWLLTFHPFRGIFIHSPMLLLGIAGAAMMLFSRSNRAFGILALVTFIVVLVYTSAYYMWWGGWSFSPRHLAPAIPLLAPAMLYAVRNSGARVALVLLAVPAIIVHVIVTATNPQVPEPRNDDFLYHPGLGKGPYPIPFLAQVWPAFRQGHTDPNLGILAGLPGGWPSLLPLMVLWCVCGFFCFRALRQSSPSQSLT